MKNRVFKIKEEIWLYPSETAAWHFVNIPKKQSQEIKEKFGKKAKGFGSLPVTVALGQSKWKTSIFPSKDGVYILPLKAGVRKKENIFAGDKTSFSIEIL